MSSSSSFHVELSVAPLGAGDLIDRSVRFYRRNFWTFILIAAPPVLIATLFSTGWTALSRTIFSPAAVADPSELTFYYLFVWFGSVLIWLVETIATLAVMGGASRNFVGHLLQAEPISFSETYRNTFKRLAGLLVASTFITIVLGTIGLVFFYIGLVVAIIAISVAVLVFSFVPFIAATVSIILTIVVVFVTLWLFFLIASRFAYVPQVILVEGQGLFAAIARSATLASGNVRRLTALFVFTTVATYSALAILYVPLGWFAWVNGVTLMSFDADLIPAWYEVSYNLIWQISFVVLSPVWTIGLCLLYVDERVRAEGYDIELMAARRLGEIPSVPQAYLNPLQPAIGSAPVAGSGAQAGKSRNNSVLGLE